MLKKRLIGTIIIKDGIAVQSMGFCKYLPIGNPEYLVENLHRWGADEIIIISIDRYLKQLGPDIDLLSRLVKLGTGTPLVFGGGIRSMEDGLKVIESGAERICIDSMFYENPSETKLLAKRLGKQAIVLNIPLKYNNECLGFIDYKSLKVRNLNHIEEKRLENSISEILVLDMLNDGLNFKFDKNILEYFPLKQIPLILFGGVNDPDQINLYLNRHNVSAIAVGNSLNYKEHAIQELKNKINNLNLRPAHYKSEGLI